MSDFSALVLLLVLGAMVGLWLKLSVARERAVRVARQQCQLHGLQLLDETVGLRALRLRRVNGLRRIERGYGFEVSIDGHDREPGRLWMIGDALTDLSLPVMEPAMAANAPEDAFPASSGKVVALRPRQVDRRP
ncbi:DUF3301 domain-containing protein [Rhodanobacter lindaniclasticus]